MPLAVGIISALAIYEHFDLIGDRAITAEVSAASVGTKQTSAAAHSAVSVGTAKPAVYRDLGCLASECLLAE